MVENMRWYLNRYSYLISSALALGVATVLGSRIGGAGGPLAIVGVGALLALIQARLSGGSSVRDWAAVQQTLRSGRPTLLFAYSDT